MTTHTAPVETVLFDLDHTLVRYQRTSGEVLQASFEACDLDPLFSVEEYYARFDKLRQDHSSIESLRAACFGTLADEHGYDPSLGRAVARAYTEIRDQTKVEFVPGAQAVLDHLDATPETTVHVGDSLGSDVAGANAAGIRSVWLSEVEAEGKHTPTHRIGSLTGLLDVVDVA